MNIGRRQQQDRENIEVAPSWAHEVDFVRLFVDVSLAPLLSYCYLCGEKKKSSLREETNVPSRRNECPFAKRQMFLREETMTIRSLSAATAHYHLRERLARGAAQTRLTKDSNSP